MRLIILTMLLGVLGIAPAACPAAAPRPMHLFLIGPNAQPSDGVFSESPSIASDGRNALYFARTDSSYERWDSKRSRHLIVTRQSLGLPPSQPCPLRDVQHGVLLMDCSSPLLLHAASMKPIPSPTLFFQGGPRFHDWERVGTHWAQGDRFQCSRPDPVCEPSYVNIQTGEIGGQFEMPSRTRDLNSASLKTVAACQKQPEGKCIPNGTNALVLLPSLKLVRPGHKTRILQRKGASRSFYAGRTIAWSAGKGIRVMNADNGRSADFRVPNPPAHLVFQGVIATEQRVMVRFESPLYGPSELYTARIPSSVFR